MYAPHFGLTQDPFSIAPDPRYLFMSERHREALAHLLYGVSGSGGGAGGGFVLLTGDIGTGKTTICRCFLEQIPPSCHVAYIFNPKLTVTELLQSICDEFHIPVPASTGATPTVKAYIDALNTFLLERHAQGHSAVLIIDEAQNLAPDVLEQLRLLTNLETRERKLLQIVLIGQPELRTMLARPELEQLAQRVIARFHLGALSESETTHYIAHRLAVAGHHGALPFDGAALQRIHALTRGVPRRINLLCDRALLGAWAHGRHQVNRAVVDQAAREVFDPAEAPRGWRPTPTLLAWGLACAALGAGLAGAARWSTAPTSDTHAGTTPTTTAQGTPYSTTTAPAPSPAASGPVTPLDELLPQLPSDIRQAWRDLAPLWQLPLPTDAAPCEAAAAQQLQCYRTNRLTLPQLRQLGRPGILSLQMPPGATPVHAVLVGLGTQTAQLRVAGQSRSVPLAALGRVWQGDFATYWRAPPGYSPMARGGSSGAAFTELAQRLDQLDGIAPDARPTASSPQVLDEPLKARVRSFQRAAGLPVDGLPGPLTLMQIEQAVGATAPRLNTALP
jgi:general secretion pathway protein A